MMLTVRAPQDRLFDAECIHEGDHVNGQRRLLAVSRSLVRKEARRAVAPQIGNEHPVACVRQDRCDIDIAINVIRPTVNKQNNGTIGRAGFRISDIEHACLDLLERCERCMSSSLDRRRYHG